MSPATPGQPGHPRRGTPADRWWRLGALAVLLAAGLMAVGVVLVRDAVVGLGWASGTAWVMPWLASRFPVMATTSWLLPFSVLAILLGLWFGWWALRPTRTDRAAIVDHPGTYLRPSGIEQLATFVARDADGVHAVTATATGRRVSISTETTGGPGVSAAAGAAVQEVLAPLGPTYQVKISSQGVAE